MAKWKCEICNSEFENFQAQGFNHKIYCPLCYFKELNNRKDKEIARLKKEHKKIIDMAIHFINLHQDSKTLSLDYSDLKKLRGLLNNDKFYIKLFKDELKELKEEGKE